MKKKNFVCSEIKSILEQIDQSMRWWVVQYIKLDESFVEWNKTGQKWTIPTRKTSWTDSSTDPYNITFSLNLYELIAF